LFCLLGSFCGLVHFPQATLRSPTVMKIRLFKPLLVQKTELNRESALMKLTETDLSVPLSPSLSERGQGVRSILFFLQKEYMRCECCHPILFRNKKTNYSRYLLIRHTSKCHTAYTLARPRSKPVGSQLKIPTHLSSIR